MSGRRVEGSTVPFIVNQALDHAEFQEWLRFYRLKNQETDAVIQNFRENLEEVGLTKAELKVIMGFEPFGYLTTISRVALATETTNPIPLISKAKKKLVDHLPNSPVIKRWNSSRNHVLKAIGASTTLDPTNLAIAFLTSPFAEQIQSISGITGMTFPSSELAYARNITNVQILKLRRKLPDGTSLITRDCGFEWIKS